MIEPVEPIVDGVIHPGDPAPHEIYVREFFSSNINYNNDDNFRCFLVTSDGVTLVDNKLFRDQYIRLSDLNVSIVTPVKWVIRD